MHGRLGHSQGHPREARRVGPAAGLRRRGRGTAARRLAAHLERLPKAWQQWLRNSGDVNSFLLMTIEMADLAIENAGFHIIIDSMVESEFEFSHEK